MSRYTAAISVIPDGDRYRLAYDVHWDIGTPGSGLTYTVPAGFSFDVSIPWFARWLFNPRDRRFLKAATVASAAAALIEWEDATHYKRDHPRVADVAAAMELPPEQVDALWGWSAAL